MASDWKPATKCNIRVYIWMFLVSASVGWIVRRPGGWDAFHLVFSPSIRVSKLKPFYPPRFDEFNIKSALAQHIPGPPLFIPLGIPRHKMRFIIIHVAGHKITDTFVAGINYSVCCSLKNNNSVAVYYNYPSQRNHRTTLLFGFVDV